MYLSKARFASDMKFHDSKLSQVQFTLILPQQPKGNLYLFSDTVSGSSTVLRNHIRVHWGNVNNKNNCLAFNICSSVCKSELDLRNHMHSHGYLLQIWRNSFLLRSNCHYIYIYIDRAIGLMSRVFANGSEDRSSIPEWVIPKTKKMVLDATLLNSLHY